MSVASNELMKQQTELKLEKTIPQTRIEAEVRVFLKPEDKSVQELIHQESKDAEIVFFGLVGAKRGEEE